MSMSQAATEFLTGRPAGVSAVTRTAAGLLSTWVENGFNCTVRRDSSGLPYELVAERAGRGIRLVQGYVFAGGVLAGMTGDTIPTVMRSEVMTGGTFGSSVSKDGKGPVVVFDGDSRTANGVSATQGYTCYGYSSWVRALSQCRPKTYNLGVSGNVSSQVLARAETVNALNPWAVCIWAGVNDISTLGAGAGAAAAANIITAAKAYFVGGAQYVVILLETGSSGWAAGSVAEMLALNQALIAYAATNRGVRILHTLDLVVDYTAATQVPIAYRSGVFADTVHPSVALSYQIGARLAAVLDSLWGGIEPEPYLMPGDASNLLINPNFGASAAISGWSGWSGTAPTGWFGYQSGAATIVAAVQANAAQPNMRELQLTITASGAGNVQFWQDPISGLVVGDNIVGASELEIVGTPSGVQYAGSGIYTLIGGVTKFGWPLFYSAGYDTAAPASSWPQVAMTQRSPETGVVPIPSGTQTNLRFSAAYIQFSGAGSATVKIRKPRVRKVAAGYQS